MDQDVIETNQTSVITTQPTFDDDGFFPDEEREIANTMDVTLKAYAIRQIEKQIDYLEIQDQESRSYYANKKAKCNQRVEFIQSQILNFLRTNGLKNIHTPHGTAYQRTVTAKKWPSDEGLIGWAKLHLPSAIRIKLEPDKKILSDHIKSTGEFPVGYSETQEVKLGIKVN